MLLSPVLHVLHDVYKSSPDLFVHQISPASIPYRQRSGSECVEECCDNVFISNWDHFQSLSTWVKRIIMHARSVEPTGAISHIFIDVRARDGCEVIECSGSKDVTSLRLGQVHTFFVKVRTIRSAAKAVDLSSKNPILNSSLDVKNLRQQLQNAVAVGAVKAHLLDIQVYHQNSLHGPDCWNYTETPLLIVCELGGLAPPLNTAQEVLKRRLFHVFVQLEPEMARSEAEALIAAHQGVQDSLKKLAHRMSREIEHYQQVLDYERECRQKLPMCPGPVVIEPSPHEWLAELWNKKKVRRQGIAVVGEDISGLADDLPSLERLG